MLNGQYTILLLLTFDGTLSRFEMQYHPVHDDAVSLSRCLAQRLGQDFHNMPSTEVSIVDPVSVGSLPFSSQSLRASCTPTSK